MYIYFRLSHFCVIYLVDWCAGGIAAGSGDAGDFGVDAAGQENAGRESGQHFGAEQTDRGAAGRVRLARPRALHRRLRPRPIQGN